MDRKKQIIAKYAKCALAAMLFAAPLVPVGPMQTASAAGTVSDRIVPESEIGAWPVQKDKGVSAETSSPDISGHHLYKKMQSALPHQALTQAVGDTQPFDFYFYDENDDIGVLSGTMYWQPAAVESGLTGYAVYFLDEIGNRLAKIGQVDVGAVTEDGYALQVDALLVPSGAKKFGVFGISPDGSVAPNGAISRIWEAGTFAPSGGTLNDTDTDKGQIGGPLKFNKAADETQIRGYVAYLVGQEQDAYLKLPEVSKRGAAAYTINIPANTKLRTAPYLFLFSVSTEGDVISESLQQIPLFDITPPTVPSVSLWHLPGPVLTGPYFQDTDKVAGKITPAFGYDNGSLYDAGIRSVSLYYTDLQGRKLAKIGEIPTTSGEAVLPTMTPKTGAVGVAFYSNDGIYESHDADHAWIWDDPTYLASDLKFTDTDRDTHEIGGTLTFKGASKVTGLLGYAIAFVGEEIDPVEIGFVKKGSNTQFTIPADTPIPYGAYDIAVEAVYGSEEYPMYAPFYRAVSIEQSSMPLPEEVQVMNNKGKADTITVSRLLPDDLVYVYTSGDATTPWVKPVTVAKGQTTATVTIPQLGIGEGEVFVSVRWKGYQESERLRLRVKPEPPTALTAKQVTVENHPLGSSDRVTVTGLLDGDSFIVTTEKGEFLGHSVPVTDGLGVAVLEIDQIGQKAGKIHVKLVRQGIESLPTKVAFLNERTREPRDFHITIQNQIGINLDTVTVTDLQAGDVVKLYKDPVTKTLLTRQLIVPVGQSSVTFKGLNLISEQVCVTVTRMGLTESHRTKVTVPASK